jgi:hypothetical protein
MLILGLDISTSCTGWAILDDAGKFIDAGYIELKKEKNIYEKSNKVKSFLTGLSKEYQITSVFIEENLQAFRPGLSSAKTLMTLSRFNGMVSLSCFDIFEKPPEMLNVNAARKSIGLKITRKKDGGKPTKEQVLVWARERLSGSSFEWPVKVLRGGPNKGKTVVEPGCYDLADALVIASAGMLAPL